MRGEATFVALEDKDMYCWKDGVDWPSGPDYCRGARLYASGVSSPPRGNSTRRRETSEIGSFSKSNRQSNRFRLLIRRNCSSRDTWCLFFMRQNSPGGVYPFIPRFLN